MLYYGCGKHEVTSDSANLLLCPTCHPDRLTLPPTNRMEVDRLTGVMLDTAKAACGRWQRELRLQDWDVFIEIARQRHVGEATMGDCTRAKSKRLAKIRLLDPRDIDGQDMMMPAEAYDWELTLVHELLHLQLHDAFPKGYPDGRVEELAIERAIDATSKALLRLSRGNPQ